MPRFFAPLAPRGAVLLESPAPPQFSGLREVALTVLLMLLVGSGVAVGIGFSGIGHSSAWVFGWLASWLVLGTVAWVFSRPRHLVVLENGILHGRTFLPWSEIRDWSVDDVMLSLLVRRKVEIYRTDGSYRVVLIQAAARTAIESILRERCPRQRR